MFTRSLSIVALASLVLVLVTFGQAYAVPTEVVQKTSNGCDPLSIPQKVDEIGDALLFPQDESLSSEAVSYAGPACLPTDFPNVPNPIVEMTNLTGRDLEEVWYIANPETRITNVDGFANDIAFPSSAAFPGQEAFRIDNKVSDPGGIHHPLIGEFGGLPDGIWQAGETWQFVLQDYINAAGIGPAAFTSIGVGDASFPMTGVIGSSGSIIAIPRIPEPSTCMLLLIGLGAVAASRQRAARAC